MSRDHPRYALGLGLGLGLELGLRLGLGLGLGLELELRLRLGLRLGLWRGHIPRSNGSYHVRNRRLGGVAGRGSPLACRLSFSPELQPPRAELFGFAPRAIAPPDPLLAPAVVGFGTGLRLGLWACACHITDASHIRNARHLRDARHIGDAKKHFRGCRRLQCSARATQERVIVVVIVVVPSRAPGPGRRG